eukprot:symbB.v1.2.016947.t1/scaffold1306.1/size125945/6
MYPTCQFSAEVFFGTTGAAGSSAIGFTWTRSRRSKPRCAVCIAEAEEGDYVYPEWLSLPLAPYARRRTLLKEIVPNEDHGSRADDAACALQKARGKPKIWYNYLYLHYGKDGKDKVQSVQFSETITAPMVISWMSGQGAMHHQWQTTPWVWKL